MCQNVLTMAKAYLKARWAEPETKLALTTGVSVFASWLSAKLGIITSPSVSLHTMEVTEITCAVTGLLPGPISSAILKQLFGGQVPAVGAVLHHQQQLAQLNLPAAE
jgi:hypothetical protein